MQLDLPMQIDARPEEVFDLMADVGNEARWNPDVKVVRRVGTGGVTAGAEWEGEYRGMGTMRIRLDQYERPRRLAFTTTGTRMNMHFTFDFAPAEGGGSAVRAQADIAPRGLMKLAGPLLGLMMRRTMAKRPGQIAAGVRALRGP